MGAGQMLRESLRGGMEALDVFCTGLNPACRSALNQYGSQQVLNYHTLTKAIRRVQQCPPIVDDPDLVNGVIQGPTTLGRLDGQGTQCV